MVGGQSHGEATSTSDAGLPLAARIEMDDKKQTPAYSSATNKAAFLETTVSTSCKGSLPFTLDQTHLAHARLVLPIDYLQASGGGLMSSKLECQVECAATGKQSCGVECRRIC